MKIFIKFLKIIGILWLAIIFYLAGYFVGHKNIVFESHFQPKLTNLELKKPREVDFGLFWRAWDIVTGKYVGTYSTEKLVYGAIKGMVEALNDPYSSFLPAEYNRQFFEDLSGQLEGIGAELLIKDGQLVIVTPLEDSPAWKAGLKSKDQILRIDDEEVAAMSLDEAVSKIRGPAGSVVTLLIQREGFSSPQEFPIKREKILISSVEWELKQDVGYIKITQFGDDTSDLAQKAAQEIAQKNPKAVILDLRNDPGGYLDAAIDVTSLFTVPNSVIVREEYKDGHRDELKSTLEGKLKDVKLMVLINEGTASASEIVAGALKDLRGATIIGQKSFGKGTVQELAELDKGNFIKITVAKWLTPNNRTIDKQGIEPDIKIDLSDEDKAQNRDPQLDKALELINQR